MPPNATLSKIRRQPSFHALNKEDFESEQKIAPSCNSILTNGPLFGRILEAFPTALTNDQLVEAIKKSLLEFGFGHSSLVATSLCSDEVNRPLEKALGAMFGNESTKSSTFSMGGLAGFAHGGATAFGAMAHHIPDGGSCLVVYGPHIGIDDLGTFGSINRRGRRHTGSCCGSANAAHVYVQDVYCGKISESGMTDDCIDAQQAVVGRMLLPYAKRLAMAENPTVELPYALFDAQDELMSKIVQKGCGNVAGEGKIALLGGIQINTPPGSPDFFMPIRFDILDNKGYLVHEFIGRDNSIPAPIAKIHQEFPTALENTQLVDYVANALSVYAGIDDPKKILLATSLCCDEVNRPLEDNLQDHFGENFSMGGLAGFCFGGVTAFHAMAHHIPDGGSCLIVYGPHIGIDSEGTVGTVNRRGRAHGGACCGSAVAAARYVKSVHNGASKAEATTDPVDAQQTFVGNMLLPFAERLQSARDEMVELPQSLYKAQDVLMQKIIAHGCGEIADDGRIALLGGIQINTPDGTSDYFMPLRFEIRNNRNEVLKDLLNTTSNV